MMKRILILVIVLIGLYLSCTIFLWIRYGYSTSMEYDKSSLSVFKHEEIVKIDTFRFCKESRESDEIIDCWYSKDYYIGIWKIKSLSQIKISDVKFKKPGYIPDDDNWRWGEVINSGSNPEIFVRSCGFFTTKLAVELDNYSTISKRIEHSNYRGFIGRVNRMMLRDNNYPYKVHIHYVEGPKEVMVIVFNNGDSFYLLMIESKKKLDEKILNIFNFQ